MKIAIISDIHSNLTALTAVLNDIKMRRCDKIFCLGDTIAKGVHSKECVKLVRENCEVVLRGNCDRHFCDEYDLDSMDNGIAKDRLLWNCKHLDEECKKYSMFLPTEKTVSQNVADMVLYGHLHHQYMDKLYNKTLINVGSVGNSFEIIRDDERDSNILEVTNAQYVILNGEYGVKEYGSSISFEFVKVHYDIQKELSDYDGEFEKDKYFAEIKDGRYRDMFKIHKYNSVNNINNLKLI